MTREAGLVRTDRGLSPDGEGWFVVPVPDAAWMTNVAMGAACVIEGAGARFREVGYTVHVLEPGQPNGMYHREAGQEDFLVLVGECLLLIEGEERRLQAWDFVHCPPGTEHIFVGAGTGPCVIFMAGARVEGEIVYPRSELALRHGAGVERETSSPDEAYTPLPDWQPGPPASFEGLPWG